MQEAAAAKGETSFTDMLCLLVQEFGIHHEGVLDMPYLRGRTMLDYIAKVNKIRNGKPGTVDGPKTFGGL